MIKGLHLRLAPSPALLASWGSSGPNVSALEQSLAIDAEPTQGTLGIDPLQISKEEILIDRTH
jgi:hypothetical protein